MFESFILGGTAGMMATTCIQPLDLIKTRIQVANKGQQSMSPVTVALQTIQAEKLRGLYTGLSAALFRQVTYTSTRLGVYSTLLEKLAPQDGYPVPFYQKALAGLAAGAVGAIVGTPADLSLVRMTIDGQLPKNQRRNYRNVFHALYRITKDEGILTLWRGSLPTVSRAMILNMAQLATYSQAKQMLLWTGRFKDNVPCHLTAALCSAFSASAASLPADMIKTKMQNMRCIDGVFEYRNTFDCLVKTVRNDGILTLWRGFPVFFARIGGHTVMVFLILEQLKRLYSLYTPNTTSIRSPNKAP